MPFRSIIVPRRRTSTALPVHTSPSLFLLSRPPQSSRDTINTIDLVFLAAPTRRLLMTAPNLGLLARIARGPNLDALRQLSRPGLGTLRQTHDCSVRRFAIPSQEQNEALDSVRRRPPPTVYQRLLPDSTHTVGSITFARIAGHHVHHTCTVHLLPRLAVTWARGCRHESYIRSSPPLVRWARVTRTKIIPWVPRRRMLDLLVPNPDRLRGGRYVVQLLGNLFGWLMRSWSCCCTVLQFQLML